MDKDEEVYELVNLVMEFIGNHTSELSDEQYQDFAVALIAELTETEEDEDEAE